VICGSSVRLLTASRSADLFWRCLCPYVLSPACGAVLVRSDLRSVASTLRSVTSDPALRRVSTAHGIASRPVLCPFALLFFLSRPVCSVRLVVLPQSARHRSRSCPRAPRLVCRPVRPSRPRPVDPDSDQEVRARSICPWTAAVRRRSLFQSASGAFTPGSLTLRASSAGPSIGDVTLAFMSRELLSVRWRSCAQPRSRRQTRDVRLRGSVVGPPRSARSVLCSVYVLAFRSVRFRRRSGGLASTPRVCSPVLLGSVPLGSVLLGSLRGAFASSPGSSGGPFARRGSGPLVRRGVLRPVARPPFFAPVVRPWSPASLAGHHGARARGAQSGVLRCVGRG